MEASLAPGDYKSPLKPIWCPGCGDFGVVQALYRALSAIGRPPHEIAFVSGIGCSEPHPRATPPPTGSTASTAGRSPSRRE